MARVPCQQKKLSVSGVMFDIFSIWKGKLSRWRLVKMDCSNFFDVIKLLRLIEIIGNNCLVKRYIFIWSMMFASWPSLGSGTYNRLVCSIKIAYANWFGKKVVSPCSHKIKLKLKLSLHPKRNGFLNGNQWMQTKANENQLVVKKPTYTLLVSARWCHK